MARRWHGQRDSIFNRDRREDSFAKHVIGAAWQRHLVEQAAQQADRDEAEQMARDEQPLGICERCGSPYWTDGERELHADAECIGGMERFR